jgi:membrane-bound lytic murein transglycosylase D
VQKNETYHQVQKKYGITVHDIQLWNRLNPKEPLHAGQQLIIWKSNQPKGLYRVKRGDNLSTIAKINNTKTSTLVRLNPGLKENHLRLGQKIVLG